MQQSNGHILYVEDDKDTCQMVEAMMGVWGYEITCVPTVAEGLSLARNRVVIQKR